ncbi:flavin-binding monooxygenase-like-domain-containing protein [Aspergillus stella-maris]|uniref:flavin-binding monooxygenase-like-domain-containing protein n=1 Tax=Aspergillus stella-maris TaxID=1810926 RepID=UPI003CCD41BD
MLKNPTVAVIGLGASGLVTMKNLAEEGFDVTGFERSDSIGGVWGYEDTPTKTTVLKSTYANGSKYKTCFTDFPHQPETPVYPHASQMHQYLLDYASHFELNDSIQTRVDVKEIERDQENGCWKLHLRITKSKASKPFTRQFDRVVIASGINHLPNVVPAIKGIEKFAGNVIHSQQFKDPNEFAGNHVLVVGLNNSAGDTATSLLGVASRIHISHRKGTIFLKRWNAKRPTDHDISWVRLQVMQEYMDYVPRLYNWSVIQLQNKLHPKGLRLLRGAGNGAHCTVRLPPATACRGRASHCPLWYSADRFGDRVTRSPLLRPSPAASTRPLHVYKPGLSPSKQPRTFSSVFPLPSCLACALPLSQDAALPGICFFQHSAVQPPLFAPFATASPTGHLDDGEIEALIIITLLEAVGASSAI